MGGKQGKEEPPAPKAPTLDDAAKTIENKIGDLEAKIIKADQEARDFIAKKDTNPSAKARAMQALKRKKQYEQQRDQLVGTQANVENLAFQKEQAEITAVTVAAMAAATQQLQQQKVDVSQVDQLVDDMEELKAESQEIQDALSRPMGQQDADAEEDMEAEFARLQEQHTMEMLMGGGTSVSSTAAPVAAPVAAGGYATAAPAQALAPAKASAPPTVVGTPLPA